MKATVFPEVTTKRLVCGDSSIEVTGAENRSVVVNLRVRRSHHLDGVSFSVRVHG